MEISPRELRDIEIREAFRGYNRDEVNELLERAAATIDALTVRVRELGDRLAAAPSGTAERSRDLEEMLERTLLLAKRTADEEVADAQAKARTLVDDAEAKSRKLVLDAEVDARRRAEEEQGKIQRELIDYGERRDRLTSSVAELERFEAEYRERLLRSIEADLAVISGRGVAAPGPTPDMEAIEIPALPEAVRTATASNATSVTPGETEAGSEPHSMEPDGDADAKAMLEAASAKAAAKLEAESRERADALDEPTAAIDALPRSEPTTPDGALEQSGQIDLLDEESVTAEVVEDDEFFSQLRDAVSDDQPSSQQEAVFFDQDTENSDRQLFRRRR